MKILDLGCGNSKHKDSIGVDNVFLKSVDVIANLANIPLPFKSGSIDKIYCCHVLEHFEHTVRNDIVNEFYRILRSGGVLEIRVPHAFCVSAKIDPTHRTEYCFGSVHYFTKKNEYNYYNEIKCKYNLLSIWCNISLTKDNKIFGIKQLSLLLTHAFNNIFLFAGFVPDLVIKFMPIYSAEIYWILQKE